MDIFYYMRGWKSSTRMVSDMSAMFSCIFNLRNVRMRIAITCIVPRVYLLKKKSVSGGSFIRGKSVKEGLKNRNVAMREIQKDWTIYVTLTK